MQNPWLQIPYSDYEKHMNEVGQAQVLNRLVKQALVKNKPKRFALLGCSSGNGLEHINPQITEETYALDINPEYLRITQENHEHLGDALYCCQTDIQTEELPFSNIDLIFAGLILEYLDLENALRKIVLSLNNSGTIIIVLQKSKRVAFVTKTKYTSLEKLSKISEERDWHVVKEILSRYNMFLSYQEEIFINENKSFIYSEYQFNSGF